MALNESLLRNLIQQYRFHLLPVPREDVHVGLVYLYNGHSASDFAELPQLFDPKFELPKSSTEDMAIFDGKVSREVEVGFGLKLLGGFLKHLGAISAVDKINASYQGEAARSIVFSFSGVKRSFILPYTIKSLLKGLSIREEDLIRERQGEYYVVTGVLRSPSITIEAKDENNKTANVELGKDAIASAKGKVSIKNTGEGSVKYTAIEENKDIAFGLQIHHLKYDRRENTFNLPEITKTVWLREADEQKLRQETVSYIEPPAMLENQTEADIYFPIS
jgi:hypothetical protein